MKICIYGAGAVGGYLGSQLHKSGTATSMVLQGSDLDAVKQAGLKIRSGGNEEKFEIPATSNPSDIGAQDCVILAMKAHESWAAAEQLAPLLGPDTMVVTIQSGVPWWYFYGLPGQYTNMRLESVDPGDRQWRAIGPERIIGCTPYIVAEKVAPGVIQYVEGQNFGLGEPDRRESDRLKALAQLFTNSGLKPRIYPEIRNDIWLKLWGNLCFHPISALTRAPLDAIAHDPATRSVARNMMQEAERIGRRLGVHFRVDIERRINSAAELKGQRTSMLQDLERNDMLELDPVLSAVQEMGRIVDLDTPYIDCVLGLTQQMGRIAGVYPAFPDSATLTDAERLVAD
ncbi:MAG: 2-dehydropantoate 2-reductase [Hyphomicrobiales bacterium]|nr:2-dehydropantoate 2-reductase [Hyphomicrobiales bacterium]